MNGFLAGYLRPTASAEPLLIMYGSQSGTAESLAKRMAKEAKTKGFAPRVFPLNNYKEAALSSADKLVVISSTWGEGDPPDNAVEFWAWLQAQSSPVLPNLRYAVLGLGDRNYSEFCGASIKFDARLEALGAQRIVPIGLCDTDYEATARLWTQKLWGELRPASSSDPTNLSIGQVLPDVNEGEIHSESAGLYGRQRPFTASLLRNTHLSKPGSNREIHHFEISLARSGLNYQAGDALGVVPKNCRELVDEVIAALGSSPEKMVDVADSEMPLREALEHHFDISKPTTELIKIIAQRAPGSEIARLQQPQHAADLKIWLWGRGLIDVLHELSQPIELGAFLGALRKLTPRLYSISSSLKAHPDEVHLTVSAVRYESFGRSRKGVASTFLADRLKPSDTLDVFIQPSHGFKLPKNEDTPIVMVGPGTGIAPFRAFLEEREASGARGKNWLIFGGQQRATDFLYEDQIAGWHKEGHLADLDLAFSRDQSDKVYVQHRIAGKSSKLWSWLEDGAHFYVCGDASRMAKDVHATLQSVIEREGNRSPEEAASYIRQMKSEGRYQRDVY